MVPHRFHSTRRGRLAGQPWGLVCVCMAVLIASASPPVLGVVTKAEIKAAESAVGQSADRIKDAQKLLARQTKALDKLNTSVERLEAEVAKLNTEFTSAPRDKKEKLAASIAKTRDNLAKTMAERTKAQGEVTFTKEQIEALEKEKTQLEQAVVTLKDRQKRELDELKNAEKTATAVAAASATQQASQAQQAEAVVRVRETDVQAAADPKARKKAETALQGAADYADKQQVAENRSAMVSEPAPWVEKTTQPPPALRAGAGGIVTPPAQPGNVQTSHTRIQFDAPMVSGDKDIVEKLDVWKEWADYITFNPVTPEEINEFHGRLTKALQQEGYVFATVTFPTRIWDYGIFLAKVDCGPLGSITVSGNRHYSAKQIIRNLSDQDGDRFNYARIHGDLFDMNARPDLTLDTKLRPQMQDGRRVINADIQVEDKLPIHGAIELSNTGTETTNDWRIRTTLQHLNLSKRDDILTVDWITSPDISDVNAFSGAYFIPLDDKWTLNVYAGYSDSDIEDVLPQLDVKGKGYYAGAQATKTLRETATYRTQLSLAWLYQNWESANIIGGQQFGNLEDELHLSMPSVTFGYASRVFDSLGGRNFMSATAQANFAGNFGSSDKAEFVRNGSLADGDFLLGRFQVARLQRLFSGEETPGKWTVFMKVDTQLASDTLPPPIRQSVGGANSVRGYEEQEIAADNTVVATLELRTPLFRNFIPGLKQTDEYLDMNPDAWQAHRLQFIAFADYGYVDNKEPLPGEMTNESLLSAGVGLRLGLTKYSQMRLDYGYPIMDTTADTPSSGRVHLSMQLQF